MIQGYSYTYVRKIKKMEINLVLYCLQMHSVHLVEEGCSDVVKMAQQSKQASLLLVVPNLDLVIIAPGHKQRLVRVKINTSDRTWSMETNTRIYILLNKNHVNCTALTIIS